MESAMRVARGVFCSVGGIVSFRCSALVLEGVME